MKIRSFELSNFRSLASVPVGSLTDLVVFYGENNTGKSNLLAALNYIFQSKILREEFTAGIETPPARSTPFYYGTLRNFADNFRLGSPDPIRFRIRLEATSDEISSIEDLARAAVFAPTGHGHTNWITLAGTIERAQNDATIWLDEAKLNNVIFYKTEQAGGRSFFPTLVQRLPLEERQAAAEGLLLHLTDLVMIVESDRFLTPEPAEHADELTSLTFKRWLFQLSLSRERFHVYRSIQQAFSAAPFNFGEITFAEDGGQLEIMILDNNGQRLPIGRLGTGVQQVLMLLARVSQSRAQIIGVEELELNLSYRNQDIVLNKFTELVRDPGSPLSQLLLTSHSDHLGSRDDVSRYRVTIDEAGTRVRRFTAEDRTQLFPRSRARRSPFYP